MPIAIGVRPVFDESINGVFIHFTVTVVVRFITDFVGFRINGWNTVIAVARRIRVAGPIAAGGDAAFSDAISIPIGIGVENRGHTFIDHAIAVVVEFIAVFDGIGRNAGGVVITVVSVGNVAVGLSTSSERNIGVAVSISITVLVKRGIKAFIAFDVAVVIDIVADLDSVRVDGWIVVVAVAPGSQVALRRLT